MLDTNVLISGVLHGGPPAAILDDAAAGVFEGVVCPTVMGELSRVLHEDFEMPMSRVSEVVRDVLFSARIVPDAEPRHGESADERILRSAALAGADAVVTGDRGMRRHGGRFHVRAMTPAEFHRFLHPSPG